MKIITVKRCWAWAIAAGHKSVENRSFRAHYRGELAIHAGQQEDEEGVARLAEMSLVVPADFPFGVIVAVAELAECHELDLWTPPEIRDSPFASGPICWQLDNVRAMPLDNPIAWRGVQSIVDLPPFVFERVQLELARVAV